MQDSVRHIGASLKAAREKKGLSQRALSEKVGIAQSHISKIENGAVNLQISSLIELARILELELMLVPRALLPVFEALQRGVKKDKSKAIPAYRLDMDEEEDV